MVGWGEDWKGKVRLQETQTQREHGQSYVNSDDDVADMSRGFGGLSISSHVQWKQWASPAQRGAAQPNATSHF